MLSLKQILILKKIIIAHKTAALIIAGVTGAGSLGLAANFATSGTDPIVPVKIPGITKEKSVLQTVSEKVSGSSGQENDEESGSTDNNQSSEEKSTPEESDDANTQETNNDENDGSGSESNNEGSGSGGGSSGGGDGDSGDSSNDPPTAPTNATATYISADFVRISANRASDPDGIARHELLRNGSVIKTSTLSSDPVTLSDTNPVEGQTYTYNVRAVDTLGAVGPKSNSVVVTVPPPDTTPPSVPTNFRITSNEPGDVTFAWGSSTDNQTPQGDLWYVITSPLNETYYYTWTQINPHSTFRFDEPGTTHSVYIQARDLAGNESAKAGPVTFTAK